MVSQWLAKPSNRNVVQVRILLSACGRVIPEYAGVAVFPAEIIKMLALVVCITVWQKSNDELTINRSNAGNRTAAYSLIGKA